MGEGGSGGPERPLQSSFPGPEPVAMGLGPLDSPRPFPPLLLPSPLRSAGILEFGGRPVVSQADFSSQQLGCLCLSHP